MTYNCILVTLVLLFHVTCFHVSHRNGGINEESGQYGHGADGGGEEPAVSSV